MLNIMLGKNYSRKLFLYKNEIFIRGSFIKEKNVKWNGEYIVTLFAAKIIKDLIKGC